MISQEWLRWGLGFVVAIAMSGAVSVLTTGSRMGGLEKQLDDYKVNQRELQMLRDKTDDIQFTQIMRRLDRIESREKVASLPFQFAQFLLVEAGASINGEYLIRLPQMPTTPPMLFAEHLSGLQSQIKALSAEQKAHKLTDHEEDELMSLEQHYELTRMWQAYCETSADLKRWCFNHRSRLIQ